MATLSYMLNNIGYLTSLTLTHLWLVVMAVGMATLAGIPLGIITVRYRRLTAPLMGFATLLLTIPSIALFGLMLPLYSLIGAGIGAMPAITAVFLYSLLPIMRNTHTALLNLPAQLREAGYGMGMNFWQRLCWLEIPLAIPVIFAGIRSALVMNIGVMAIASVIGAGGLGILILNGINTSDIRQLITATLLLCLLALLLDALLSLLQRLITAKGIR